MSRLFIECGIYQIVNTKNGNLYIGSSNDLNRRKSQHFHQLRNGTHSNPKLQSAYTKTNLTEFAEQHNLIPSSFNSMANGKRTSLFGWKVAG